MRTRLCLLAAAVSLASGLALAGDAPAPTRGVVHVEVTTRTTGQKYAPKHVLALWVADARGRFVKTLVVRGESKRGRLSAWRAAVAGNAGAVVDAVTGATARQHGTVTADWDCRDVRGGLVPDGWYQILVEFSEGKAQGPVTPAGYLRVLKGTEAYAASPKDLAAFTGIQVSYQPATADALLPGQPVEPPAREAKAQGSERPGGSGRRK